MSKVSSVHAQAAGNTISPRILLLERISDDQNSCEKKLKSHGIEPVRVLNSEHGLLAAIEFVNPDVLILSIECLDHASLENLILIKNNAPLPVVIFARKHAAEMVKTVVDAGVSSYIVDDVEAHRIPIILELAQARFAQEQALNLELVQTKEKLLERKVIEKAKGILMAQSKLSEDQAYVQLRKSAMNQGRPMADLAKSVISVFEQRA